MSNTYELDQYRQNFKNELNENQAYFYKNTFEKLGSNNHLSTITLSSNTCTSNGGNSNKNSLKNVYHDISNAKISDIYNDSAEIIDPNQNYESYPRVLHLPPSIQVQNDLSWGFWNWIYGHDSVQSDNLYKDIGPSDLEALKYTKVYTYNNHPFHIDINYQHHTKHTHLDRGMKCSNELSEYNNKNQKEVHDVTVIDEMVNNGGTIDLKNYINKKTSINKTKELSTLLTNDDLLNDSLDKKTTSRLYIQGKF